MSSPFTGIGQLHITVSDLEESVRFYRDVLGLPHLFTVEGQPMAFFQAGSVRLYLGVTEDESFRSRPVVYYWVEDVESAYAEVTGRGAPSWRARTSCTGTAAPSSGWRSSATRTATRSA